MALLSSRLLVGRVVHQLSLLRPVVISICRNRTVWRATLNPHMRNHIHFTPTSYLHTHQRWLAKKAQNTEPFIAPRDRKIIFVDENGNESQITKGQAQKLARTKELKLVIVDGASQPHPTYKLMTGLELHEERVRAREIKKAEKKKEQKVIRVTSRISTHDLEIKSKHVQEWLDKGHEVKMAIKSKDENDKGAVDVLKFVSDLVKDNAQVIQAKNSARELVYVLRPKPESGSPGKTTPPPMKNEELKAKRESPEET